MPTSHNYTLSKDRLIILDSILTDENINIGRIINREIRDCARKQDGFLFFPCLITALCMKHKVPINEHEHSQRKYPPSALSAQMKARKIITNPEELKKEKKKGKKEEEVQKHEVLKPDDSKWKAIRNYLWEQHEFLEARLAEISQTPTCLEMPEFPIWVFDDIDDENEKEEEEEGSDEEEEVVEKKKKKKELKRKQETVRKGKAKKKKVEEVVISDSEEEEDEIEKELKEMEKQTDEEDEDTTTEGSEKAGDEIEDLDLNLSLEEYLRKKKGKSPVLEQIIPPQPEKPTKQPTPPSTGTTPPPPEPPKKVAADVTQEEAPISPTIEKDPPTHQTQENTPPQAQNIPLFPANIVVETGTQEPESELPTQKVIQEPSVPATTGASAPSASAPTQEPPVIRVTEDLEDILRLVAVELAVKKRQEMGNTQKFFKSTSAATIQPTMEQGGGSKEPKEKEQEKTPAEEEETALKDIADTLKDLPDQIMEPSAEKESEVQSGAQAPDAQAPTPAQPSKKAAVKGSASASKTPKAAKQKPKATPTRSSNRLRSGAKPQ